MVLGAHVTYATGFPNGLKPLFNWLFDGNLGVRFFFVISGFLITWLLLQEWNQNRSIDLRNFYIRRCLRILPVYFAFLLVLWLLQYFGGLEQSGLTWIGCLTFTRNTFGNAPLSAHLWSLSVEEQFYLLWPATLLLICTRNNLRLLMIVVVSFILLGPMFRGAIAIGIYPEYPTLHVPQALVPRVIFFVSVVAGNFFKFIDALSLGCLAAILLNYQPAVVRAGLGVRPFLAATVAAVFIVAPHVLIRLLKSPPVLLDQMGNTLQALGVSIFLLHGVLMPGWGLYRALNWAWVRQIGILSYSIYIWQQLVWGSPKGLGLDHIWWMGLWIIPLMALALISYYALERPLMRLRTFYRLKSLTTA